MHKIFKAFVNNQDGVAAVEFALVAPILILMLIGTIDMGLYIMNGMRLQSMASATADYAAQSKSLENLSTVADETYQGDYADVTMSSAFSCECSDGVADECPLDCGEDDYTRRFVTIGAQSTFDTLFPYPGLPEDLTLQRSVRMRVD